MLPNILQVREVNVDTELVVLQTRCLCYSTFIDNAIHLSLKVIAVHPVWKMRVNRNHDDDGEEEDHDDVEDDEDDDDDDDDDDYDNHDHDHDHDDYDDYDDDNDGCDDFIL